MLPPRLASRPLPCGCVGGEPMNGGSHDTLCSVPLPKTMRSLFWNVDFARLDVERDADLILSRVLERGRLHDVHWVVGQYGLERIRRFFNSAPRPEVSRRTRQFWRVALGAKDEKWPEPPAWRQSSSAPWID